MGLSAYWLGVWRQALRTMKDQDTWDWALKPLLDEYVHALIAAECARDALPLLDRRTAGVGEIDWDALADLAGALPTMWDRHVKRAARLADQLGLTPQTRRRVVRCQSRPQWAMLDEEGRSR